MPGQHLKINSVPKIHINNSYMCDIYVKSIVVYNCELLWHEDGFIVSFARVMSYYVYTTVKIYNMYECIYVHHDMYMYKVICIIPYVAN